MKRTLGIRREDKNQWEGRTPLIPEDIKDLVKTGELEIIVEPSDIRGFKEEEFLAAGANISNDISHANIILGIKEIPSKYFRQGNTYLFFSHTIKGQDYNMPMLKTMMDLKCNLLDYECIKDKKNRRLIAFGRFAGLAGIVDTIWAFGQRLSRMGIKNPFEMVRQTIHYQPCIANSSDRYPKLNLIKKEFEKLGNIIREKGLPHEISPLIIGIAGYGNVSLGVQELLDILPVKEISPFEIIDIARNNKDDNRSIYKAVFKEEDMVVPVDERKFHLQDYYDNPQYYRSIMSNYLPFMNILVNSIFWTEKYPRILTLKEAKRTFNDAGNRLIVIGDISVDINGAIELAVRATDIADPVFIYDIEKEEAISDFDGNGPLILAVDNLPCEFPRDSSSYFSQILKGFVKDLASADYSLDFESINLPSVLKDSMILHKGRLTRDYEYINNYL